MIPTKHFWILLLLIPINLIAQDWGFTQKIVASDRSQDDGFGELVAISGNFAIVGVIGDDTDENNTNFINDAGSVYFFEKNTSGDWIEIQKAVPSDRLLTNDFFGRSVAISENIAVVGKFDRNKAYVFERDNNGVWQETQILTSSNAMPGSFGAFGRNVAIQGNYIIIGSQDERAGDNTTPTTGAVYIFERSANGTWTEIQRLLASDGSSGDDFGESVAISGDYIVVGALLEDEDENGMNTVNAAGSAYIFERNSSGDWIEIQKIVAPSGRDVNDSFGNEIAIDTNYLVIGTFGEDTDENDMNPGFNPGAAFVYELNTQGTWVFVKKLVASDRTSSANFGGSVSISGNYIISGARGMDSYGGAAYVFERDQNGVWTEQQKLIAPSRAANDWFGDSVAIEGGTCFVGASKEDEDSMDINTINNAGSTYIFEYNGNLSVDDFSFNKTIIAYPNPVSDVVYFKTNTTTNIYEIQLYSIHGELLKSLKSNAISELNIENLPKGFYIIKVKSEDGLSTFKVLKE